MRWVKVTYSMPVIAGQGIRHITAGYDVQVIDHEPGKVLIRWRGNDYWVTRKALDSNGPRDLFNMLNRGMQ
jgi:hypothetical protein